MTCSAEIELGDCLPPPAPHVSLGLVELATNSDVYTALAGSTKLYGSDSRPCDGSVMVLTIGSKTLEVGGDCGSGPGCGQTGPCVPVPPGLKELVDVLNQLDQEETLDPACAAFK
jgi:hypothetical protein